MTARVPRAALVAVVRELASRKRHSVVEGTRDWVCALCGGPVGDDEDYDEHAAGCVWLRARALCARLDARAGDGEGGEGE